MARINIESKVWTDLRFKRLSAILKIRLPEAVGLIAMVWHQCTELSEQEFSENDLALITGMEEFGRALIDSELGSASEGGKIYLKGSDRCLWLETFKSGHSEGGNARASNAKRGADGRFVSEPRNSPDGVQHGVQRGDTGNGFPASANQQISSGPAALTLTPSLSLTKNNIYCADGSAPPKVSEEYLPAKEVIEYLNVKASKSFRAETYQKLIKTAIETWKFSVEDLKKIIDTKSEDPYFKENPRYLRPQTLFSSRQKIEAYLNEGPKQSSWKEIYERDFGPLTSQ